MHSRSSCGISLVIYIEVVLANLMASLKVMHGGPNMILHRDIWPDIVWHIHSPRKWFLLDWEDALTLPMCVASHLRSMEGISEWAWCQGGCMGCWETYT